MSDPSGDVAVLLDEPLYEDVDFDGLKKAIIDELDRQGHPDAEFSYVLELPPSMIVDILNDPD